MPTVRTYGEQQVRQQGLPGARMAGQRIDGADPDAFGAVQARQATVVGKTLDRVAEGMQRAQDDEDAAAVFEAKNQYREQLLEIGRQVKERRGLNAKGAAEWGDAEAAKLRDKVAGTLKAGLQQSIFTQDSESMRVRAKSSFMDFESREVETGLDDSWSASKELAVRHAQTDPNPANIASIEAEIRRANAYQASRKGWAPEVLEAETRKDMTKMHGGIIGSMLDGDDIAGAQSYLQAHGDKLDPEVKARAEKWIHGKQMESASIAMADELIGSGVPYGEALERVRSQYKGEDADRIARKVTERYGEAEQIKREKANDLLESMNKKAFESGSIAAVSDGDIEKLGQVDPERAMRIRSARDEALQIRANGGDFAKVTNKDMLAEATQRLVDRDISKPEELQIYKPYMTGEDFKSLERSLDKNRAVGDDELWNTYKIFAPDSLKKKDKGKWSPDDWAQFYAFKKHAQDMVRETANPEAIGKLAAEWWLEGKVPGSGIIFDDTTTQGAARMAGKPFEPAGQVERNAITEPGFRAEAKANRVPVRTGKLHDGRKATQYSDGTIEYE